MLNRIKKFVVEKGIDMTIVSLILFLFLLAVIDLM